MEDMSLEPLALTFALLVFWIGLGWSLITAAEPNMQPLRALFLAPVTGVALTILPAFWLNILGLPVGSFARPLAVVLCCIIVAAWIWRRPAWTRREAIFVIPVRRADCQCFGQAQSIALRRRSIHRSSRLKMLLR
jgi:hypothetical protein